MNRLARAFALVAALPALYSADMYRFLPAQSDDIEAVIRKATERMNFITRPIARSRLKGTNDAYAYIEIEERPDTIIIAYEGRAVGAPASGVPVAWTREDGEKFEIWMKRAGDRLTHHYRAEDGERTNEFSWSANRDTLRLDVTLVSPRLPEPVKYRLSYLRDQR